MTLCPYACVVWIKEKCIKITRCFSLGVTRFSASLLHADMTRSYEKRPIYMYPYIIAGLNEMYYMKSFMMQWKYFEIAKLASYSLCQYKMRYFNPYSGKFLKIY